MKILSVNKIWDAAAHNALTDLLYYKGKWFCALRESDAHVYGCAGVIRILSSDDGKSWTSSAFIAEEGVDLRDPKLSIAPSGSMMLLAGGTTYQGEKYLTRRPRVSFTTDGVVWMPMQEILQEHDWLWRITWHEGVGYGASYTFLDPANPAGEWGVTLYKTVNGIQYEEVVAWKEITGNPSEVTLRFLSSGEMIALVRRHGNAYIGKSSPPYTAWEWYETSVHIGGPDFIVLPKDLMIACGRIVWKNPYGLFEKVALFKMNFHNVIPLQPLPSALSSLNLQSTSGGNDTSYPGMVYKEGILWVSHYSSHEGKTAIYLAKILLES